MPPNIELSPGEKLAALKALDEFRRWESLDDRRRCLACGDTITGWQIRVVGPAPFHLECPTADCPAIPMDWSLLIAIWGVEESATKDQSRAFREKSLARA
jgi:hypothetical protein